MASAIYGLAGAGIGDVANPAITYVLSGGQATSLPYLEIVKINSQTYSDYKKLLLHFGNAFLNKYEDERRRNLFIMTMAKKGYYKAIEDQLKELCFVEIEKIFNKVQELKGRLIDITDNIPY